MRCAIYLRVSKQEQTVLNQLPILVDQAKDRGWEVVKIYQEEETAWKAGHQREWSALVASASRHEFDVCLTWALDRVSRLGIEALLATMNTLSAYHVRLVSHEESWTEMPNEMTPMFAAFAAWAAKYESDRKSARIRAAVQKRRDAGLPVGRIKGAKDKGKRKRTNYLLRYADRIK